MGIWKIFCVRSTFSILIAHFKLAKKSWTINVKRFFVTDKIPRSYFMTPLNLKNFKIVSVTVWASIIWFF